MRFSTLGYSIKQGVKNIWRNKMFSLASIATMGACIFLFGIFFAVVINFNYIVKNAETDVSMTVFFNEDVDQATIDEQFVVEIEGKLWLIPALIFGIGIFSTFFVTSSNLTASQVVAGAFGIENINLGSFKVEGVIVMGVLLCILTYVVTSGGTKKIASLFSKLVPFMSVLYILMGLGMIIININRVPSVFTAIVTNAFTGTAAIGGFAGCAVSEIIRVGMARSVYQDSALQLERSAGERNRISRYVHLQPCNRRCDGKPRCAD